MVYVGMHEEAEADLGIMLLCCWKGPAMGLPLTRKTGLGLLLPEAEARCAVSSFTCDSVEASFWSRSLPWPHFMSRSHMPWRFSTD